MSAATVTATAEGNVSPMAGPPPIAMLLPFLQHVLTGSSLLFRLGIQFLVSLVSPLGVVWSILRALLSPIIIVFKLTLDFALFTPFSIVRMVAVTLYPVYVFCAAACILGATVGIFGHYLSTSILNALARSKYFARPPSPPVGAAAPSPQVALRKRKRRSVRTQ